MRPTVKAFVVCAALIAASAAAVQAGDLMDPASLNEQAPDTYRAKFETTKGDFVVEVHRAWAPLAADRFYNLVKNGYFDDQKFFRVVPNFVVQWGLHGDPEVTAVWRQQKMQDEPVRHSNEKGAISFAMAGPNSRTTQVFINLRNNGRLDGMGFSAFGTVVEGMDVVEQLYDGYGRQDNTPNQGLIGAQGNVYLEKSYPKLDGIRKATVVEAGSDSGTDSDDAGDDAAADESTEG